MLGVCIKYYHENYGGMLQAYATTKVMEKRHLDYEIIRYKKKVTPLFIIKSIPRIFNRILLNDKYELLQKKINLKFNKEYRKNNEIRSKYFGEFRDTEFKNLSKTAYGYKELKKCSTKYNVIITGSDQLWSPAGLPTNFYNLMFVDDKTKKVSYASSFGVKKIPWYQKNRTRAYLKRLDYISVRENNGAIIVKELIGKDVPVVLDPVCMLDSNEWASLISKEKIIKEKYIFAYFLGKNQEYRREVEKLSKKLGMKIVALKHLDQYVKEDENFGDYTLYDVGPREYLNLLKNAEYIFTDSFHGSMFSIIFNKQFVVFNRYKKNSKHSKNSRIESLCSNLGLNHARYTGDIMSIIENPIGYADINKKLDKLIGEANAYLDKAISSKRGD